MAFANATELLTVLATQRFSFSVDHLVGAGDRQPAANRGTGSLPRYYEWSGSSDIGACRYRKSYPDSLSYRNRVSFRLHGLASEICRGAVDLVAELTRGDATGINKFN
jgi:hypothetical protein